MSATRKLRKILTGSVVSDKMNNTVVVSIINVGKHHIYEKTIIKTKKYLVDNPENKAKLGDIVEIMECRPISKRKKWRMYRIVSSKLRDYALATEEAKIIDKKIEEELEVKKEKQTIIKSEITENVENKEVGVDKVKEEVKTEEALVEKEDKQKEDSEINELIEEDAENDKEELSEDDSNNKNV